MKITDLQLHFCRDRAAIIGSIIPREGHTCVDQPNLPCTMCTWESRIELSEDENGVLCDVYLGRNLVERFYPAEFVP